MDFPPILILAIVWLLIGLPLSKLNKAKQQQQQQAAKTAKPGPAANPAGNAPKQKQPKQPTPPKPVNSTYVDHEPVRPTALQPSITFTEHDDSVYQGSMNVQTGEGYDPCHDEQLAPLSAAEAAVPAAETAEPGLQLSWTGSDVVRGFVMSEILTRR